MSTTPAPRTLFAQWIDDAAALRPGRVSVPRAWSEHVALLGGADGDLLGPLVVDLADTAELERAASAMPPPDHLSPVSVALVGGRGTSVIELMRVVRRVQARAHLRVTRADVVHGEGDWRHLVDLGVQTAVEVPREGRPLVRALDDLSAGVAAEIGGGHAPTVLAKLGTRATPGRPAPDARGLAEFLTAARDRELAFMLSGGLHRAVAPGPPADEPHGALNVLLATSHLLTVTTLPELMATLQIRDGAGLAALTRGLSEQDVRELRARFVSFTCSEVRDPIGQLRDLGLVV